MADTDDAGDRHRTDVPNPILPEFWVRPADDIEADLAVLARRGARVRGRARDRRPASPLPQGPGSWVVTNHADILQMSRHPDLYSSASGITFADMPMEFVEYFSSMIAMDDPRHARLRRLVSAGFTPRMLKRLEDSVQELATKIVDDVIDRGECDFVVDVAAALPLKIVCDLMGVPESQLGFVFDRTNVILGIGDPEYTPEGTDMFTALLTAGQELSQLDGRGRRGQEAAATAPTSPACSSTPSSRRTSSPTATWPASSSSSSSPATRPPATPSRGACTTSPRTPTSATSGRPTSRAWRPPPSRRSCASPARSPTCAAPPPRTPSCTARQISAGDKLCMFYLAANRDEAVFEDPYRFDVRRSPNDHIGFGGPGPHFCLGAHLARREITVMFRELFQPGARHPGIRPARAAAVELHPRRQAPPGHLHPRRRLRPTLRRVAEPDDSWFPDALRRAKAGHRSGFDDLVRHLDARLVGFARARGADDPEGLADEVLVQMCRAIGYFDGNLVQLRAWVFTIARNRIIDERRRAGRRVDAVPTEPDQLPDGRRSPRTHRRRAAGPHRRAAGRTDRRPAQRSSCCGSWWASRWRRPLRSSAAAPGRCGRCSTGPCEPALAARRGGGVTRWPPTTFS